jgi:hypothetical protein
MNSKCDWSVCCTCCSFSHSRGMDFADGIRQSLMIRVGAIKEVFRSSEWNRTGESSRARCGKFEIECGCFEGVVLPKVVPWKRGTYSEVEGHSIDKNDAILWRIKWWDEQSEKGWWAGWTSWLKSDMAEKVLRLEKLEYLVCKKDNYVFDS